MAKTIAKIKKLKKRDIWLEVLGMWENKYPILLNI
jgi:hypothetical protein